VREVGGMTLLFLLLVALLVEPTAAQTPPPGPGVAGARAQLVGPGGAIQAFAGSDREVDAGTLTAKEIPDFLDLALQCTVLPPHIQITLFARLEGAPVRAQVERDKGARLEVQVRGIPFATRVRLFEVAEMFLAKGAYDVRVEGPVAGRNIEARIRDRVPQGQAVPLSTTALPPPSSNPPAGPAVELVGRWRSTTLVGATLVLRPAAGGLIWELDAPRSAGLAVAPGPLCADGTGTSNAEAVAAATATRNVPVTIEFVKEGTP